MGEGLYRCILYRNCRQNGFLFLTTQHKNETKTWLKHYLILICPRVFFSSQSVGKNKIKKCNFILIHQKRQALLQFVTIKQTPKLFGLSHKLPLFCFLKLWKWIFGPIILRISLLFASLNSANFDRWTIFVGPVVPEICSQEAKIEKNDFLYFFCRSFFIYIGRSAMLKINWHESAFQLYFSIFPNCPLKSNTDRPTSLRWPGFFFQFLRFLVKYNVVLVFKLELSNKYFQLRHRSLIMTWGGSAN